jgi:MFS superfamily sulfate permease-like transporter
MAHVRNRFWAEVVLGVLSAALLILTTAWPDWIESVFRVDPDGGNGALEWAVVVVLATCTVALPLMAGSEWRRARTSGSTAGS